MNVSALHSTKSRRTMAAVASTGLLAGLFGLSGATAQADAACPGGTSANYAAPTDAAQNSWEFEGTISAVDQVARTITVNGASFKVPGTLLVKTHSLDQTQGNISLTDLLTPADIAGNATGIAQGHTEYGVNGQGQQCATFVADSVYVERAENVLVGALTGVAPDGQSIYIAGGKVEANKDSRWPTPTGIMDATGTEVPFAELAGHEGLMLEAEGYFSTTGQALQGTVIATDQILTTPVNGDTVVISRAEWKDNELRLSGVVSPAGTSKTVTVYPGRLVGSACDTAKAAIGTAAVGADGAYSYRNRNVAYPGAVCVQSSGGGADDITVVED